MNRIIINTQAEFNALADAKGNVCVDSHLEFKCDIKAGGSIEAGLDIEAGCDIFSFTFSVSCKTLTTKKSLPFWRNYYLAIPPLAPIRGVIADTDKCWDDIRVAAMPHTEAILAWDGWHPLVLAQVKMFLGVCESVPGDELNVKF